MPLPLLAYSLDEAARAAGGVSRSTLERAIRRGALKAKKIGSRTIIPAASLEAFINDQPDIRATTS